MHRWVDDLGDVEPLGQETDAAVDFAQALLAVEIVAVLGAVAVLRRQETTSTTFGRSSSSRADQLLAQALEALAA